MPSPQLSNYLLSHRKRLGFSQAEIAFLLGTSGGDKVCRDERFAREPSLARALAYEAIFQRPVRELFAGLYEQVEQEVVERAKALQNKLHSQKANLGAKRKLQAMADMLSGLSLKLNQ